MAIWDWRFGIGDWDWRFGIGDLGLAIGNQLLSGYQAQPGNQNTEPLARIQYG